MSVEELLAKLSTGSSQRETVPIGGTPELTQSDIAAAMTGIPQGAALLIRVKYAFDTDASTLRSLRAVALLEAADISIRYNWWTHCRDEKILEPLTLLALDLVINEPLCKRCDGIGERRDDDGLIVLCNKCEGTGAGTLSKSKKAAELGQHRSSWTDAKEAKLQQIISHFEKWETLAIKRFRQQISRHVA